MFRVGAGSENMKVEMFKVIKFSSSSVPSPIKEGHDIKKANSDWKDCWYDMFDWIEFNQEMRRIFCKICKEGGGKFAFATDGSTYVKVSPL